MLPSVLSILLCFIMNASSLSTPAPSSQRPNERKLNHSHAAVSSILDTIPAHTWDDAAASLLEKGVATGMFCLEPIEQLLCTYPLFDSHSQLRIIFIPFPNSSTLDIATANHCNNRCGDNNNNSISPRNPLRGFSIGSKGLGSCPLRWCSESRRGWERLFESTLPNYSTRSRFRSCYRFSSRRRDVAVQRPERGNCLFGRSMFLQWQQCRNQWPK